MAHIVKFTHFNSPTHQLYVNLDQVVTIETASTGSAIKFVGGTNVVVAENPGKVAGMWEASKK